MAQRDEDRAHDIRLLEEIGMAAASLQALDVAALAEELGTPSAALRMQLDQLEALGLCLHGLDIGLGDQQPLLLPAGSQFLSRGGVVDQDVLRFLPRVIDNLDARAALLHAGTSLVEEFRHQILIGGGVAHAAQLVPPAFVAAVDDALALDLFAAAVAVVARVSDGSPTGCVAEEIMAVGLIGHAEAWLDTGVDNAEIDAVEANAAMESLNGMIALLEDADILELFELSEPADVALAPDDPPERAMGVGDQRIAHWFDAFAWTPATGHLNERTADPEAPSGFEPE